jgi:FkbM family methyltransferase
MTLNTIAGFLQSLARRTGLEVARSRHTLRRKRVWACATHNISTVLDVGANEGQYARQLRDCGYKGRIISFEPVSAAFESLDAGCQKDSSHECLRVAVGDCDGEARIKVAKQSVESSLLRPTDWLQEISPGSRIVSEECVKIVRLDSLRRDLLSAQDRVLLKIDAQGYEMEILKGASETLEQVVALELELSLSELYEGQVLLPALWGYINTRGFKPVWIERGFIDPSSGFLLQVDGLFLRRA